MGFIFYKEKYMANWVHYGTVIPVFDLHARFCYFLDLNKEKPNDSPIVADAKKATYTDASITLNSYATGLFNIPQNESEKEHETILSAITFLQNIAQSERNKEIRIVKQYIDDIKKSMQEGGLAEILKNDKHDDLTNLLNDLENFSNNPTAGSNFEDFYKKLILIITSLRTSVEQFKNRIEQLNDSDRDSWSKIAEDNILFRTGGDIDTALKGALGIQQRTQDGSLSRLIISNINKTLAKLFQENAELFLTANPAAVVAGIMIEFEVFIQDKYKNIMTIGDKKEREKLVDALWKEYEKNEQSFLNELKNNTDRSRRMLDSISSKMGFGNLKEVEDGKKAFDERQRLIEKQKQSKTRDTRNQLNKTIRKIYGDSYVDDFEKNFKWNMTTGKNGQHGLIYELFEALRSDGANIRGSAGTDVVVLDIGKINMDIKESAQTQLDRIQQQLEKSGAINSLRKNRYTDLSKAYEKTNEAMRAATMKLNKILEKNKIPEDIFIYHESLKLYASVEEGKHNEFEGRTLGILNALDSLYTANNIAGLELPSQEILYGIVLNLAKGAVAASSKPLVENYLSIFAGLLMFDDIQNIALDAARQAQTQVLDHGEALNIHLYLLNDIYVPGSLLLTSIANAMQEGYKQITSENNARAVIDVSAADQIIGQYLSQRADGSRPYRIKDWREIGNSMAGAIKVKILFLKSFLDFMGSLDNYMK